MPRRGRRTSLQRFRTSSCSTPRCTRCGRTQTGWSSDPVRLSSRVERGPPGVAVVVPLMNRPVTLAECRRAREHLASPPGIPPSRALLPGRRAAFRTGVGRRPAAPISFLVRGHGDRRRPSAHPRDAEDQWTVRLSGAGISGHPDEELLRNLDYGDGNRPMRCGGHADCAGRWGVASAGEAPRSP